MSASILWEPIDPNPRSIRAWAPSSFLEAMERAGMGLPCQLGKDAIPVLRGMAATFGRGAEAPNPYQDIIDAIEENNKISLWAEY